MFLVFVCLQLAVHFHPSVSLFAKTILQVKCVLILWSWFETFLLLQKLCPLFLWWFKHVINFLC